MIHKEESVILGKYLPFLPQLTAKSIDNGYFWVTDVPASSQVAGFPCCQLTCVSKELHSIFSLNLVYVAFVEE